MHSKRKKKHDEVTQEVNQNDLAMNASDNVTVPRHELKRMLWELNELKISTHSSIHILKENAR